MKLSRPQYHHIRLDTDYSFIQGHHVIQCNMGFHPGSGLDADDSSVFVVGAKCSIIFFIGDPSNEVAGYLGEVYSTILTRNSLLEDKKMLLFFAKDTFNYFVGYLREQLPALDVNFIPPPDFPVLVEDWVKGLEKLGLYQT